MKKTFVGAARWAKRLLLLAFALLLLWQLWLFGWVLWWKWNPPQMTRFMEIRLESMRKTQPKAVLYQQWVDYGRLSPYLKRAVVSAEDDLFVQHSGFDWNGIQKALEKNQQRGRIVAGGSTISQQLAKNLFLSPNKTFLRKAQEAVLTVMIELTWDKQRILEVYLNVIEWGNGIFGAEAAARHYYGVGAARLNPAQAARLAAMIPSPRRFDRLRESAYLAERSDTILGRMHTARIP